MPCQKETLRTNDEIGLRKPVTLISYLHLYLEIKAPAFDCTLKFLPYSAQSHSERIDGQN